MPSSERVAVFAGCSAMLVGIGLARFGYSPLIPAVIAAGWFSPDAVIYLGAANLAGYFAGALLARRAGRLVPVPALLRAMMLLVAVSLFACAVPLSLVWMFLWRFASGIAGAVIMVLAAPAVLVTTAPARRGLIGGLIFAGVGIGVILSGTLVPLLLGAGLVATWCGLGGLCLVLTILAWGGWPDPPPSPIIPESARVAMTWPLRGVVLDYGLNALGLVPHMVFLVDYVARGLGQGVRVGAVYWVLYGIGAAAGPLLTGRLGDRFGFGRVQRVGYLVQAGIVGLPLVTDAPLALGVSAILAGAATPGVAPLMLGRLHELLPGAREAQQAIWARTTMSFALLQALGGYGLSALFSATGGAYAPLFAVGVAALLTAFAIDCVTDRA